MHFPFLSYILDIFKLSNFYNNMADMYLTVAVILFAIDLIFSNKKVHHEKN
jgi:signal peptidase II